MTKVLGMGNALVDIMTKLESDKTLELFSLPKGSMQLVDIKESDIVNNGTEGFPKTIASGGSAANTIHGLARLGVETGFIGKVGEDEFGMFFQSDLEKSKIEPILFRSQTPTGKAIALITPDSERTFATYLGAAVELVPDDITPDIFKGYDYFHIEGYLVQNHDLIEKSVKIAKNQGLTVSLDMASYNVVEDNLEFLRNILEKYVDIVFANEEEAKAFSGKEPAEALNDFAALCGIAVVKTGKNGSLVKMNGKEYKVNSVKADTIDTTGAGDLYAAGFLYGLIKGYEPDKCGYIGSVLAAKTIEVMGPKMDKEHWSEAYRLLEKL